MISIVLSIRLELLQTSSFFYCTKENLESEEIVTETVQNGDSLRFLNCKPFAFSDAFNEYAPSDLLTSVESETENPIQHLKTSMNR